jgi:acetolactate synthase I/II/III large subunit
VGRRHLLLKVHLFGPPSPVPTAWPLVVLGDDGLLTSLGEIDAAIHLGLPMLIVVMNDAAYGAEVHHFHSLGLPTELARFKGSDFAAITTAMGAKGVVVRSTGDLE